MSQFGTGRRRKRHRTHRPEDSFLVSDIKPIKPYDQFRDQLHLAINGTPEQYKEFSQGLIEWIAQPKMLHTAYQDCRRVGGRTPGPDTICIDELSTTEVWSICRELGQNISSGIYRPAEPLIRRIKKIGNSGWREITIYNVADRFVAKAAAMVLTPILDHHLSDRCYGGRQSRGPIAAIAAVYQQVVSQRRFVWLCHDLKNAFHRIPRARLLDLIKRHFPTPVITLVGRLIARRELRGVPQGLAISLLLLHTYLDHFLDRPWERLTLAGELWRYVDDLLVACRTLQDVEGADRALRQLLNPTGMSLKGAFPDSVVDLSTGQAAEWIGYSITLRDEDSLAFHIRESAWERLHDHLQQSQECSESTRRARQIIRGWLHYNGPCFEFENRCAVLDRVAQVAGDCGFDDLPSIKRLGADWRQGWTRFQGAINEAKAQEPANKSKQDHRTPAPSASDDEPF